MATESYKSFNGGVIPGGSSEVSVRGKIHRIALWDVSPSDPTPRPLESWVIDLEDPNTSEPSGYSKLTVTKANEIHRNGEIFGLRVEPIQNPYGDDLLIETKFSSYSGTNLEIRLSKVSDQNVLTEYVILDYDQLAGISEHSEIRALPANSNDLTKNKFHRIGVRLVQGSDPSPKPMTDWVIDLESPNSEEPDGYDRLTVARAKEIHNNGEVFAFTSYSTSGLANNKDIYYESIYNSSSSYLNIVLTKMSNHQNPTEISRAMISDYGDYLGVSDASAESEYLNVTLVQQDSDALKKNKIHRYSFGDATIGGETPVYGSWLIDLDKPDPNGPEGYARVTPAEFWKSTAVNGEVPVYLQDKNANNSLTYAYLSRTDVTKSGGVVTSVFAYFVRSGYGNVLAESNGFRFTKLPGSDYLQKATSTEDSFTALSKSGDSGTTKPTFSLAAAVANIVSGETLAVMLGKIAKWFSDGFPIRNYGTETLTGGYTSEICPVDNNGYTKIVNPSGSGITTLAVEIHPTVDGEIANVEIDIENSGSASMTVRVYMTGVPPLVELKPMTIGTNSVAVGKTLHISAHGMGWLGSILDI